MMQFIAQHWDTIGAAAGVLYGLIHRTKSAKAAKAQAAAEAEALAAKAAAARTKAELEAILAEAHKLDRP